MILAQPYTRYSQRPPKPKFLTTLGESIVLIFTVVSLWALALVLFAWFAPVEIGQ